MDAVSMQMQLLVKKPIIDFSWNFGRKLVGKSYRISSSSFQLAADHESSFDQRQISTTRRSGNYKPPLWDFDFIQSLDSDYSLIATRKITDFSWNFGRKIVGKYYRVSSSSITIGIGRRRYCSFQLTLPCDQRQITTRRSGNYDPTLWDFDYIQSLDSDYSGESQYSERAYELKLKVKDMLEDASLKTVDQLELIDDLQRLGISYHFEDEIKKILSNIYKQKYHDYVKKSSIIDVPKEGDLYSTALEFRLLRQYGFVVPQDIFDCFKDEKGEFKSSLRNDTKGLLQLYEASHLLTQGESTLELARQFSTKNMQRLINLDDYGRITSIDHQYLNSLVWNSLEMPLHWRVQRPNSRLFIESYIKKRAYKNSAYVFELAKLDFNIVQAIHQQELKEASRWWKKTCLAEKLPFARDRLVENYFWTIGGFFEPQYGYSRVMATKVNAFITVIDDIYDVYGTLEELELFTTVIQRWDMEAMEKLPNYMQICFLALHNFINEMAYDVFKEQGVAIVQHLRKSWTDLCESYLQEARWYSKGYTPRLEEYMKNAWISISAPVILTHAFFLLTNPIEKEAIQSLYKYHDIIRWSATILRLANDLGTSPYELKRGDVPKSVQCYMSETRASETQAREYIGILIHETWKKMNEERIASNSPFSKAFIRTAVDLGRMAQYMYQHGDGHGIQNPQIRERISSSLFEPIVD